MKKIFLGCLACVLLAPVVSPAAIEPLALAPGGEAAFFDDMPVVLSVTRLQQNLRDVPGFVTVIDSDQIKRSGARDLAELLRGVPGFQVAFGPYGAPVATYHGLGSTVPRGLQVLIDGRSQYSTLIQGGVSWNLIDVSLEDIERIEVLRGSNSPTYGSNSFMGVVNVITRHAATTRGALAAASKGNQGIADYLARVGFGEGAWNARLTAESKRDEGEPLPFDDRKTTRVNLRIDGEWPDGDSLRIQAGMMTLDLGLGYPVGTVDPLRQQTDPHRFAAVESGFLQLHWLRHDADWGDTQVRAFRVDQRMQDFYSLAVPLGPLVLSTNFDNSGRATRDDLELQHTFDLQSIRLAVGWGWRKDEARHTYFYGPGREVEQTIQRVFGELEWRPNRYLTSSLAATAEDDSISGGSLAPRAAINVHLTPSQTVKLIAGKSRRLPTLYESKADERLYQTIGSGPIGPGTLLNIEASSSGNIRAEEVVSQEFGYLGEFRELGLTLDARLFKEKLKNRIQTFKVTGSPDCPVFETGTLPPCVGGDYNDFANTVDATIRGWESQLAWQPLRQTRIGLSYADVKIDSAWISALPFEPAMISYLNRSSPRQSMSVWLQQRFLERVTLAASYYESDAFKWTQQGGGTDAYHRLDWRLAYEFRLAAAKAELAWTVRNDGSNHSEWLSREGSGTLRDGDLIGTRHFVSLRLEY